MNNYYLAVGNTIIIIKTNASKEDLQDIYNNLSDHKDSRQMMVMWLHDIYYNYGYDTLNNSDAVSILESKDYQIISYR